MVNTELTKIREDKNLSKSEFAKMLGVSAMLLGKYEKGSCQIPEEVAAKAAEISALDELPEKETSKKSVKDIVKKAADAMTAAEIEVKKTVRKGGRKAKEAAVPIMDKVEDKVAEAAVVMVKAAESAEKTMEPAAKTTEKAVKAAKKAADKLRDTMEKKSPSIIIEASMGGQITVEEIMNRLPENVEQVYIKPEENKAYWVGKEDESGSIDLW